MEERNPLYGDREILMAAIKGKEWTLKYASEDLQRDREIVMAAVKQHGWALRLVSEDLQRDR